MAFQIEEQWRPIEGYEDKYWVSNLGRVKSKNGILKPLRKGNGTLGAHLYNNDKGKDYLIHQLVAQTFIPNPKGYTQVKHKDGDIENNRIDNLEWFTRWNSRDLKKNFKLTDEFYFHLHRVEKKYGSIVNAPDNDLNLLALHNMMRKRYVNE